jgi:hypothetical protein
MFDGFGKLLNLKDQSTYEGGWRDGQYSGKGIQKTSKGVYEGEFSAGMR